MKTITDYIKEALKIGKSTHIIKKQIPKDRNEFFKIFNELAEKTKKENKSVLNLSHIDISEVVISQNGNISFLFRFLDHSKHIERINITGWDFSNVKVCSGLFAYCDKLKYIDGLDTIDFSNVFDASEMFFNCFNLDISCVTNMNVYGIKKLDHMFASCNSITNLDALKNWDISKAEDISGMFASCKSLTNIDGIKNWGISSLHNNHSLAGRYNGLNNLFDGCIHLENIDLSNWKTEKQLRMLRSIFRNCFSLKYVKMPQTIGKIETIENLFEDCVLLEKIENFDTINFSSEVISDMAFYNCKKLSLDLRKLSTKFIGKKIKTGANKIKI